MHAKTKRGNTRKNKNAPNDLVPIAQGVNVIQPYPKSKTESLPVCYKPLCFKTLRRTLKATKHTSRRT